MKDKNETELTLSVYLMRHGDSRQDGVRRFIGRTDHRLNESGLAQARWWRKKLDGVPFSKVFSSDMQRSIDTAAIIAEGRDVRVEPLPELREIDLGEWDGRAVVDIQKAHPEEYERRGLDPACYRTPGGESFIEVGRRVWPAFEDITGSGCGNVLVVGHAGVNRVVLCRLLGMPLVKMFRLGQDYGCLNLLHRKEDGGFVVASVNIPPGKLS
jgi:probable phosphoglycerate mutase